MSLSATNQQTDLRTKLISASFLVGIGAVAFGVATGYRPLMARVNFQAARAIVLEAGTKEVLEEPMNPDRGPGDQSYVAFLPVIKYRYEVEGQVWVGDRYDVQRSPGSQSWAASIVAAYTPGEFCDAYYDPGDPSSSALTLPFPVASCVILAIGLVGLAAGLILLTRWRPVGG